MSYYVAVHGGAGFHSNEDDKQVRNALRRACKRALKHLQSGSSACVAVEESISELEDSKCLNAGYGSNLTREGTVECDAAIMDGSGNFGSVGALAGIKNPICAAKVILDHSGVRDYIGRIPPLTLVSSGAYEFVSSHTPTVDPSAMISPRAQSEWALWTERSRADYLEPSGRVWRGDATHIMQDTVGSISLDTLGGFAAGVSSGGLLLKQPGRVGEAAIFGAGCWAQHSGKRTSVACSASGTGEAIIRASLARSLSESLSRCPDDPHEEINRVLTDYISQRWMQDEGPRVGMIILTKDQCEDGTCLPRLWCAFNTASMAVAYGSSHDPAPKSTILRQSRSEQDNPAGERAFYLTVLPWTVLS